MSEDIVNNDSLIPVVENTENKSLITSNNKLVPSELIEHPYGNYIKKSRICPICMRNDNMEINRLRAVDHLPYDAIINIKGVTRDALDTHFSKHFIISTVTQDILNLKEDSSQEANEIIKRVLEGEVDLFGGSQAVLKSKIQRLHDIRERLKFLSDRQEIDSLEDIEKQEYIMLNKLAEDTENSIMKVHQILHKKVFPSSKEELTRSMLAFKMSVLSKFVDDIVVTLIEFERNKEYQELIRQIRLSLSQRVSSLEALIFKSGGILQSLDDLDDSVSLPIDEVTNNKS